MEALVKVLGSTLSIHGAERAAAEKQLIQWAADVKFLPSLLTLCSAPPGSFDVNIQKSAAAYFKNIVTACWTPLPNTVPVVQLIGPMREQIMMAIVPAIVGSTNEIIRNLLSESLKVIADQEWPENWPKLMEQVLPIVGEFDKNPQRALGAALCVHTVCRRYQSLTTDVANRKRWPIHRVAEMTLAPMGQLLTRLMAGPQSQPVIEMQIWILKIFRCCVEEEIPPILYRNPKMVSPWIELIVAVLTKEMPLNVQPQDPALRPKFVWWRLKKWAAKILYRVARKMIAADIQIPPTEPSDDVIAYEEGAVDAPTWAAYRETMRLKKEFARHFEETLLAPIFTAELRLFGTLASGAYLAPRVVLNMIHFTDFAMRQAFLYKILEPSVGGFLTIILFKLAFMDPEHRQMFFDEPVDFCNLAEGDKLAYSVNANALYLIRDMLNLRRKCIDPFMKFLSERLGSYAKTRDAVEKEAVLACIGSLDNLLVDSKKFGPSLEGLMEHHVLPEITGGQGTLLEWRALWTLGRMWSIRWTQTGLLLNCAKNVVSALKSPHLPIKLMAASTLPSLCHLPPVAEAVHGILPSVVQSIIALSRQIDSETIMASLDMLVRKYPGDMAALSLQLIPLVIQSFRHAAQEQNETAVVAGYSALELLTNIVDECADYTKDPKAWMQLEALLVPFCLELLGQDTQAEFWELGIKILCAITFEPPFPNSAQAWQVLPALYQSWVNWAKDYMCEIWELWDNFMHNGPDVFLGNAAMMQATLEMIRYGLQEDTDQDQLTGALKLFESLLCTLRGRVDNYIQPLVGLLLQKIKWSAQQNDQETVMVVVTRTMLVLWYNPVMGLALLEQSGSTSHLLQSLSSSVELMTQKKEKKMAVLGLAALLYLPPQSLPQSIKSRIPQLVSLTLDLQMELWQQRDEETALRAKMDGGGEDGDANEGHGGAGFETGNLGWARPAAGDGDDDDDDYGDAAGRLDFAEGIDDFEAQLALMEEESQCQALERVDEVDFWFEGVTAFGKAGGQDVYANVMRNLKPEYREWHAKLTHLVAENRKAKSNGPPRQ